MQPDDEWLERFAGITRKHILTLFRRDSCITSTRIGVRVLRHFGVLCRPQPVKLMAFTADAYEDFAAGRGYTGRGHSLGIVGTGKITTRPDGRRSWDGHLVILLPRSSRLVDLSLDQVDRPAGGLRMPGPGVSVLSDVEAFRAGEPVAYERQEDGVVLAYWPLADTAWKQAPDWVEQEVAVAALTEEIIEELM